MSNSPILCSQRKKMFATPWILITMEKKYEKKYINNIIFFFKLRIILKNNEYDNWFLYSII